MVHSARCITKSSEHYHLSDFYFLVLCEVIASWRGTFPSTPTEPDVAVSRHLALVVDW